MSMIAALVHEIQTAEEQNRPLLQLRVTLDAIAGTAASLPITPERLRALYPESVVMGPIANGVIPHHGMELVVHPDDWLDVLADPLIRRYGVSGGDVDEFCGLRVVREHP